MKNAFLGYKKYNSAVKEMAKAYVTKLGATDCLGEKFLKAMDKL